MSERLVWEYSRNRGCHWITNGEFYKNKKTKDFYNFVEIRNCTPMGYVNQCRKQGYDLFIRGKRIRHGLTVKDLKTAAGIMLKNESAVSTALRKGRMLSRLS